MALAGASFAPTHPQRETTHRAQYGMRRQMVASSAPHDVPISHGASFHVGPMHLLRCLLFHLLLLAWAGVSAAGPDAAAPTSRWVGLSDALFKHQTAAFPLGGGTHFAQDTSGFLWVGSQAGLMRWDGYNLRKYTVDPQTPGSLPDSYIASLHTDKRGRLWLGTNSRGLVHYDADTDSFVLHATERPGQRNATVTAVIDDDNGGLWIGTNEGLDHMDATGTIRRDPANAPLASPTPASSPTPEGATPSGLPEGGVVVLLKGRDAKLWVGTRHGLLKRDHAARGFSALPLQTRDGSAPSIERLYEDSAGRIWVGTRAHGAFIVEPGSNSPHPVLESGTAVGLATDRVTSIVETLPGEIWLGTDGGGIVVVDARDVATRRLRHRPDAPTSLNDDNVYALYRDRSGLIWVATNNAVSLHDPQQRAVITVLGGAARSNGLSLPNVPALIVTSQDRVWASVGDGGIDMLDPMRGRVGQLRPDSTRPQSALPKGRVMSLAEGPDGEVYIGTLLGLYRSDAKGRHVVRVNVPQRNVTSGVWALCYRDGILWVGGIDGLWTLDVRHPDAPTLLNHDVASTLGDSRVTSIAPASDRSLWIGTRTSLVHLDTASGVLDRIPSDPTDPTRLPGTYVSSTLIDRQGRLWVSSFGVGVQILERQDASGRLWFRRLGVREGLPHAGVNKLLEDSKGDIWASTDDGLAMIDAKTFAIRPMQRPQGVSILGYWTNAGAVTTAGELIFGGQGGISIVRPEQLTRWTYPAPVVVTDARAGATPLSVWQLNQPQDGTSKPHDISAKDRALTVEFSALDYSAPERNRYAYRLQGFDTDWITTESTRRFASYTNLPPGNYTLQLRGSNRDGDWTQAPLQIPIRVLPAWYQTLWFRGLASLLALALIGGLVQTRTLYLRRRQRELQGLVDERTATLVQRSEELRASQHQLEQIAYIDPLTGLPNRRLFNDDLRHQTALAARGDADFTLMLIDLDGFKQINDRFGHDAGDAMLEQTASRLLRAMRESDRVWRTGGDEFAVLLPRTSDRAAVDAICRRIVDSLAEPLLLKGTTMRVGASIGVALCPAHGHAPDALYKAADVALYAAKHSGRGTWRWHDSVAGEAEAVAVP